MKKFEKIIIAILLLIVSFSFNIQDSYAEVTLDCTPTLKRGDKDIKGEENIKNLQKALNSVMGCGLVADGAYGSLTETCVKSFQQEYSLTKDGKAGVNTCKKLMEVANKKTSSKDEETKVVTSNLNCASALKSGSEGSEVKNLQTKLNKVIGCDLTVDGKYGSKTSKCVKKFQSKMGLTSDGNAGRKTCRRLDSEYNEIVSKNNEYVISKGDTKIREKASSSSKKITTVSYGKVFEVYGMSGNWYKIKYNNKYAYINSSEVTKNVILLDKSDQNLRLYKKGKLILDSLVVTGNESKGWKTPTGKYAISYKQKAAKPGSKNNEDRVSLSKYGAYVDYWMPFYKGYGFHDADWRTADSLADGRTYTTNGSHGCVNMLPEDAKILYNNISTGYNVYIVK